MSLDNSLTVACGDAVVVAAMCNAAATSDVVVSIGVATTNNVVVVVRDKVVVWVQQCLMRPCKSLRFAFVSVVVTPTGKEPS